MREEVCTLIDVIDPQPNTTILIYDVHASESGALAILDDFYNQVQKYADKSVKWIFVVSTPEYEETENIMVLRFPWVKKNWVNRLFFDNFTTRLIIKKYNPDKVFSLQNKGIPFFSKDQFVYLHLPFILTEHRFTIEDDGVKLWLYQNVIKSGIFSSLRTVKYTIVQTQWMKEALVKKVGLSPDAIIVQKPDISSNKIGRYIDSSRNRKTFFYPATAFSYKNHITLLKALKYAKERGLDEYKLILTIKENENKLTSVLSEYVKRNGLCVVFGGPIPRHEVLEMYTHSVLLFPSYVESFGLPLLEAKMTESFIISSDCPFSREILDGYDKVIFFSEMDYKGMGDAILHVVGYN